MCIRDRPYTAMFEQRPPQEITEIINFQPESEFEFNKTKFFNNAVERADKLRLKYQKSQPKIITYEVGDKVLLKNRELPSACLLYTSRCV